MKSRARARRTGGHRLFKRHSTFDHLHVVYEGYSERIPLRAPDLSPQGMFINTSRELPEGAVVQVRFRLTPSNFEVQARGEVRYCLPGVGVGIEFVDISAQAQKAIQDVLRAFAAEPEPVS